MARRMSWVGCKVKAVTEIMPRPAGLTRNIVQCLKDFDIPLYLSSQTTNIFGKDRVEGVEITPIKNGILVPKKSFRIDCDTVLLSVGLVPENELSKAAGVEINAVTNGPEVDLSLMTNMEGVFACGNVLHVHDLVDWVCEESRRAGKYAVQWLRGEKADVREKTEEEQIAHKESPSRAEKNRNDLICVVCPVGCALKLEENAAGFSVTGNRCPRGETYAIEEIRAPKRTVTATCKIDSQYLDGEYMRIRRVPVKTSSPCPREKIPALLDDIYKIRISLPVKAGDVVIADWNGEGIDVVAARSIFVSE
jgi:CxxC motif-containing protein